MRELKKATLLFFFFFKLIYNYFIQVLVKSRDTASKSREIESTSDSKFRSGISGQIGHSYESSY